MDETPRERASDGDPWRPPHAAHDPHYERQGESAYDADGAGVGEGEEGFQAEDYPGRNPLRNESPAAREAREREARAAPHGLEDERADEAAPRADERIRAEVIERVLRVEPERAAIAVRVEDGTVVLEGRVRDADARRTLERASRSIEGVRAVVNRLAVG